MGDIEIKTSEEAEVPEGEALGPREEGSEERIKEDKKGRKKQAEEISKQELLEKLKDAEQKAQEHYDLYMRTYAEMENIKKRGMREREELAKFANESLIKELLSVIDNLNKAISHAQNDENPSGLVEGLELTLDGLKKTLERGGLKEVEAEGKEFDPNFHEAVSKQADDNLAPGHVIMELQKGYLLNGRLIRPAMVVISQGNSNRKENSV